ncbi:MAG TPA: hypothetical protein GXX15_11715 [Clostridia bacterium]|nr:hypothetical protein [Clostridia bacterium]
MNKTKAKDFFLRAILFIGILASEFLVCFLDAFIDGRDTAKDVRRGSLIDRILLRCKRL